MIRQAYRYRFRNQATLQEAEETLLLAMLAAEGLFGRCRLRMDVAWAVDESINTLVIDADTLVGMTINLIFTAFITAEFGADAFDVRRVEAVATSVVAEVRQ